MTGASKPALTARMTTALAIAALVAIGAAPAAADTIAITGATIYQRSESQARQRDDRDPLRPRSPRSAAGVAVPAGATRIDGKGKTVTAGLIEGGDPARPHRGRRRGVGQRRPVREPADRDPRRVPRESTATTGARSRIPVARTGGVTSAITGRSAAWSPARPRWCRSPTLPPRSRRSARRLRW